MRILLKIIPIALYVITGLISLIMAVKSLTAEKFLPFHEKAAQKSWEKIENPLKGVILSLIRLGGLGFLTVSLLLIFCPLADYFIPDSYSYSFYKFSIPVIALIFCTGLFIINFLLARKTKVATPWIGSLISMIILVAGIVISFFK
jgi:hypothetical protein